MGYISALIIIIIIISYLLHVDVIGLHHNAELYVLLALFYAASEYRSRRRHCRFYARRHIFHQHFCSLICNDDDRALQRTFSATHYCHTSKLHSIV